jgi:hypothetical protein
MIKFEQNAYPHGTVTIEIADDSTLDEALDAFGRFLRAVGYVFDGEVLTYNSKVEQVAGDYDEEISQ